MNPWPLVPLAEVIKPRKEFIRISDFETYKRCRVQLHAKGIMLRDTVSGSEIKTKEQQVCRAREFLVAEIDAKVGGFGVIPDELDGSIVSSHYFLFEINEEKLDRRFLDYFVRTPFFRDQVAARGSTNYAAIRPHHVLQYQIPLPPLPEQHRIVARIEELAAKVEEARGLRRRVVDEIDALLNAALHRLFGSAGLGVAGRQPISRFSTILRGRGPIYTDGSGKLAINQKCVRWEGIDTTHAKEVSDAWVHSIPAQFLLQEHDVVVNSTGEGTIGRASVVSQNAIGLAFDSHVLVVRPERDMLLPSYLAYFLKSPIGQATIEDTKGAKTTKQTELGTAKLGDISLPVPPLVEQRRIVAYLDGLQAKAGSLKRLQAETAAELDAMLPSVLDKAFKGEL